MRHDKPLTPMTGTLRPRLVAAAFALLALPLHAGWEQVTALDAPLPIPHDPVKAHAALREHLQAQIAANESFLKTSPDSPHAWEARIRLASAQGRLASIPDDSTGAVDKAGVQAAIEQLRTLERTIPERKLRAEAMFRRISLRWQDLGDGPDQKRETATALAGQFFQEFPEDRRAPRLLAEAASLCNYHPADKKRLIDQAISVCSEEALLQRLQDDMLQLQQLGRPVDLRFNATDGSKVDLLENRGHVTALVFWAAESAPSVVWMGYFRKFADTVPSLRVVTVSLDRSREDLDAAMKTLHLLWPTEFDGMGWQNPIARRFGINTLPTLCLIDADGRLAFLNARDDYEHRINELLLRKGP